VATLAVEPADESVAPVAADELRAGDEDRGAQGAQAPWRPVGFTVNETGL
jgi:hypothetical protein